MPTTQRRSRGFTLISLVVAVAVIGISAAVTVPALMEILLEMKLKNAARETFTALRWARLLSIKQAREHGVVAGPNGVRIFLGTQGTDADDPSATRQTVAFPLGVSLNAVDGFDTSPGGYHYVTFSPDGSASKAGAFELINANFHRLEIRLDPAQTARVRLRTWDEATSTWKERG